MARLKQLLLIIAAFVLALLPSAPALAASAGVNLTTSPLPVNLSAIPGQTISTDLRVQNSGDQTQKIKVSLMKFGAYGDTGKPALQDRQPGDDYFDWVSFSPAVFNAPPKQWMSVKMTINVPKGAAFGYYYAVVFSPADQKATGKGSVYLGSTAVLVLLDVQSPNAKRSAQITDFKTDKRMYEFLPVNFTARIHNTGNVHIRPAGSIYIKRGSKTVATVPFNPQGGNVLPNSYRVFTASWSDGFPVYITKQQDGKVVLDKNGQEVKQLSWDFTKVPKLKFGHYTANLLAVYDNGTRDVPMEASVSFWVVPWRIVAFVVVIGGLALFGLWSIGKSLYKKIRKPKK